MDEEKAATEEMDRVVLGDFNCNLLKHDSNVSKLEEIAMIGVWPGTNGKMSYQSNGNI